MVPTVALIQTSSPDLGTLLGICQQALGYSVAAAVDASSRRRTDAERFISCLAAMQNHAAKPGFAPHLLSHAIAGVLVAADEDDMAELLSLAEMPFVSVPTLAKGVQLAVITGTLSRWKEAVKLGSTRIASTNARAAFNRIMAVLIAAGMDVWKECESKRLSDGTLLLEDKR
jgi:hypothetical protein